MRTRILLSLLALACLVPLAITPATAQQGPPPGGAGGRPGGGGGRPMMGPPLQLTSSAFTDGTMIPDKYTCSPDGKSMTQPANMTSPPLSWVNAPNGTQSFVLLLHDPDAHARKPFDDITHWMIFNIPGDATSLPEGVKADSTVGVQAANVTGQPMFFGPWRPQDLRTTTRSSFSRWIRNSICRRVPAAMTCRKPWTATFSPGPCSSDCSTTSPASRWVHRRVKDSSDLKRGGIVHREG